MTHTLTLYDEAVTGDVLHRLDVTVDGRVLTVADLIRARVTAEVEAYNRTCTGRFNGLVQPTASERLLNGFGLKPRRAIDAEAQIYKALDAYQKNGFFLLIDDRQAGGLDETIALTAATTVRFVKLVPLVGG